MLGHEVRTFQPCGSTQVYWARFADTELFRRVRGRYQELASRPYGRIFVRLRGRPAPEETRGFAADYDGYFDIGGVVEISADLPAACGLH